MKRGFWTVGFYIKTVFWLFVPKGDILVSERRKRVPQVRTREDNQYVYCRCLVLTKMILIIVWTRRLGFKLILGCFVHRTIGRPIWVFRSTDNLKALIPVKNWNIGRPIYINWSTDLWQYCSILLSGWDDPGGSSTHTGAGTAQARQGRGTGTRGRGRA